MSTEAQQTLLRTLKIKRGVAKATLTKCHTYLETSKAQDNIDVIQINTRLLKIESLWSQFFDVHAEICSLVDDEISNTAEADAFEENYFDVISLGKHLIEDYESNIAIPNKGDAPLPGQSNDIQNQLRLPQIILPSFSGAYEEWMPFHETFNSLIHCNKALNNVQKFHYLKSCLKNEATNCIQELQISEANYNIAWSTLKDRFDNKRIIIKKHIQAIYELPQCSYENYNALRHIYDTVQKHTRALKALKRPVDQWDDWLIYITTNKLDKTTNKEWESTITTNHIPSFQELLNFLSQKCNTLEAIAKPVITHAKPFKNVSVHLTAKTTTCAMCNENHLIYYCKRLLNMQPEERIKKIKLLQLCINCLKPNHSVSQCNASSCKKCKGKHNTLLHITQQTNNYPRLPISDASTSRDVISSNLANYPTKNSTQVLLSTAVVDIKDKVGNYIKCRALLDSGSQASFISKKLAEKLQLDKQHTNISLIGVNQASSVANESMQIKLKSRFCEFTTTINCLILKTITQPLPVLSIERKLFPIPKKLKLADPDFNTTNTIDLLIGAELFWSLLCVGQIKPNKTTLCMQKTLLGWIISGTAPTERLSHTHITCNFAMQNNINEQLTKFWEIEEVISKNSLNIDEKKCETQFINTYQRDQSGRIVVELSLREGNQLKLGNSRDVALKRFYTVESKLQKQPLLKAQYTAFMQEYETLNHMRLVHDTAHNEAQTSFYLPHHAVIKEDSMTTKLRVVFDGSAKSSTGTSLNDILMVGPTVQQDLFSIICRFRTHPIVITADIEKMYRQIKVNEKHHRLQRILWRTDNMEPVKTYELTTVSYGTACAAFLATRALKQVALEESSHHPLGASIIQRDFYVDDLLTGASTVEDAKALIYQVNKILSKGGFTLRKWASNTPEVLEGTAQEAEDALLTLSNECTIKTLGLQWSSTSDTLQYKIAASMDEKITKRSILSCISQIFDPLGLLGPIIIRGKLMMQMLWQLQIDWDESVPMNIHTSWLEYKQDLQEAKRVKVPRHVINDRVYNTLELHGFSDASENAYGACIYIRSSTQERVTSKLLCSKSRVAPLKGITIPRLELCAAVLLSNLMNKVKNVLAIPIHQIFYWTDSTIVLAWIRATSKTWKTFVANRVNEIQELTNINDWHHVGTTENPSDLVSRGSSTKELVTNNLWWIGPSWLNKYEELPINTFPQENTVNIPEIRNKVLSNTATIREPFDIFTRYSNLHTTHKMAAHCLRFINNVRAKCAFNHANANYGVLSISELKLAKTRLLQNLQQSCFSSEYSALLKGVTVHKKSKLLCLNPFLDENKLIRVGGRLRKADLSFSEKHPLILPSNHAYTNLVIKYTHERQLHAGVQGTLAAVRDTYWPLAGKNSVKRVLRKCITCFKVKPSTYQYIMSDLPQARVQESRPFINAGVDYAGPLSIREARRRGSKTIKAYIALFICLASKAIHLEVVSDLTTDAFLNALKRMIARRGRIRNIYSDNATNFIGADRELQKLYTLFQGQTNKGLHEFLSSQQIKWNFIPPRAPHFGGIWEAGVKSLKYHLRRTAGNAVLTYEELTTLSVQIEAVLNSRPICPMSSDPNDLCYLTPGHFLIGMPLTSYPEPNLTHLKVNQLSRYQLIESIKQHFWSRWSREYLHSLQTRTKWKDNQERQIQLNDLVLIKDDNLPPLQWTTGRVQKLLPGDDGVVRCVTIKTSKGEYTRATSRLCVLPVNE